MPTPTRGPKTAFVTLVVLLALLAAACSSKDDEGSDTTDSDDAPVDTAVLGEENLATDSTITFGAVTDGVTEFGNSDALIATLDGTVQYVNEHLGGLNGHELALEHCETGGTPSGATQCAVQMAEDEVAAVLVPVSSEDATIVTGLEGSGIPYVTYSAASQEVILSPDAFLLTNPISQIAAPGLATQEAGGDKVGFILIDVPAATGPITQIAEPIYDNLGLELQIVPISPSVADMTPQIQEAISGGADIFTVTGTDDFNINALNALDQLGYEGDILLGPLSEAIVDGVPSGFEGILSVGTVTTNPDDEDLQLYNAILETYTEDIEPNAQNSWAFSTTLAVVRALTGLTDAVDAPSISDALANMPEPVDLPLGAGITFQCGSEPVSYAPAICSLNVLSGVYDQAGVPQDVELLEVPADALALG